MWSFLRGSEWGWWKGQKSHTFFRARGRLMQSCLSHQLIEGRVRIQSETCACIYMKHAPTQLFWNSFHFFLPPNFMNRQGKLPKEVDPGKICLDWAIEIHLMVFTRPCQTINLRHAAMRSNTYWRENRRQGRNGGGDDDCGGRPLFCYICSQGRPIHA